MIIGQRGSNVKYLESDAKTKPYIARNLQAIQFNKTSDRLETAQEIGNLIKRC